MKSCLIGMTCLAFELAKANVIKNIMGSTLNITDDLPDQQAPQKIPKIFHTIWIDFGKGNDVFPKYHQNMKEFEQLHSHRGWSFVHWKEAEILVLIQSKYPEFLSIFQSYDVPIKKQDAARYIILDFMGGVYIDHDFIPLKNIDPLLKFFDVVLGNEEKNYYAPVGGFFASVPNHPLLKKIIEELKNPEVAKKFVLEATGPGMINRILLSYVKEHGNQGIKLYSSKFFYPVHYNNKSQLKSLNRSNLSTVFPESFLLQEYDTNWI